MLQNDYYKKADSSMLAKKKGNVVNLAKEKQSVSAKQSKNIF